MDAFRRVDACRRCCCCHCRGGVLSSCCCRDPSPALLLLVVDTEYKHRCSGRCNRGLRGGCNCAARRSMRRRFITPYIQCSISFKRVVSSSSSLSHPYSHKISRDHAIINLRRTKCLGTTELRCQPSTSPPISPPPYPSDPLHDDRDHASLPPPPQRWRQDPVSAQIYHLED